MSKRDEDEPITELDVHVTAIVDEAMGAKPNGEKETAAATSDAAQKSAPPRQGKLPKLGAPGTEGDEQTVTKPRPAGVWTSDSLLDGDETETSATSVAPARFDALETALSQSKAPKRASALRGFTVTQPSAGSPGPPSPRGVMPAARRSSPSSGRLTPAAPKSSPSFASSLGNEPIPKIEHDEEITDTSVIDNPEFMSALARASRPDADEAMLPKLPLSVRFPERVVPPPSSEALPNTKPMEFAPISERALASARDLPAARDLPSGPHLPEAEAVESSPRGPSGTLLLGIHEPATAPEARPRNSPIPFVPGGVVETKPAKRSPWRGVILVFAGTVLGGGGVALALTQGVIGVDRAEPQPSAAAAALSCPPETAVAPPKSADPEPETAAVPTMTREPNPGAPAASASVAAEGDLDLNPEAEAAELEAALKAASTRASAKAPKPAAPPRAPHTKPRPKAHAEPKPHAAAPVPALAPAPATAPVAKKPFDPSGI